MPRLPTPLLPVVLVPLFALTFVANARAEDEEEPQAPAAEGPAPSAGDVKAIVFTFDSGFLDAGLAGQDAPGVSIPMPTDRGRVTDWGALEAALREAYEKLGAQPEEHPALFSETVGASASDREHLARLMFDTFKVPAFFVATDSAMTIYAAGRTTGLAVTSHDGATITAAVYEGYHLPHSRFALPVGRRELAARVLELAKARGYDLGSEEQALELLDQHGYIAADPDLEAQKAASTSELDRNITLPDGQTGTLGAERFQAFEPLVKHGHGLAIELYNTIMKCDVDLRSTLAGNIVLSGRLTTYPGLVERLKTELTSLLPQSFGIRIVAMNERKHATWIGGSILSSTPTFQSMWVSRDEYAKQGAAVLRKKII